MEYVELRMRLPDGLAVTRDAVAHLLTTMSYAASPLVFEIVGTANETWTLWVAEVSDAEDLHRQMQAHFPQVKLSVTSDGLASALPESGDMAVVEFALSEPFMLPLASVKNDPFVTLIGALASFLVTLPLYSGFKLGTAAMQFVEREPCTIVISEKGWVRTLKGHVEDISGLAFKTDDKLDHAFFAESTSKLLVFGTNGKFYSLEVAKLPGGRGYRYFTGTPLLPFGHGLSLTSFSLEKTDGPDAAALAVTDEPLLRYLGVAPTGPRFDITHFPAARVTAELAETSPDAIPPAMRGRSAARLR